MLYPLELLRFIEARDKHHLVDCLSHYVGDVREKKLVKCNILSRGAGGTDVIGII